MLKDNIYRLVPLGALMKLDASKDLPSRLTFLKWGENQTTKGKIYVGQKTLAVLPTNQRLNGFDTIALDFEHNTVPGSEEYKRSQEPRPIAAKGKPFVELNVGVGIDGAQWTDDGQKFAGGGHYEDLSGAVAVDANNEVVFLHSGALCRQGSAFDIHLFSAGIGADGKLTTITTPAESHKDPIAMDFKKFIIALFTAAGLKADDKSTDAELEAHQQSFLQKLGQAFKLTELSAKLEGLTKSVADLQNVKLMPDGIDLKTLSSKLVPEGVDLKTLSATVTDLVQKFEKQERDAIVMGASYAGKVVPASALPDKDGKGGMPVAQLKALVAELPVTVPINQRTPSSIHTLSAGSNVQADSASAELVRQSLGISKEEWDGKKAETK